MSLLQTPQHSFADWRIFGIFKNDQISTFRDFSKCFLPGEIHFRVLVITQKIHFPQKSEINRSIFSSTRVHSKGTLSP